VLIANCFVRETTAVGFTEADATLALVREYLIVVPVVPVVAVYVPSKGWPTPCTMNSLPTAIPCAEPVVSVATFVVSDFVVTENVFP
jgi:hypothetical protein